MIDGSVVDSAVVHSFIVVALIVCGFLFSNVLHPWIQRGNRESDPSPCPLENHKWLYVSLKILVWTWGGLYGPVKYEDD